MKEVGVYDYHRERKQIGPNKAYVEVIANFSADGKMLPLHRTPIRAEHSFSVTGVEGIEHPLRGFTPS
mgnify:CR=1 FL=1